MEGSKKDLLQKRDNRRLWRWGQDLFTGVISAAFSVMTKLILIEFISKEKVHPQEIWTIICSIPPDNILCRSTGSCYCALPSFLCMALSWEQRVGFTSKGENWNGFLNTPLGWAKHSVIFLEQKRNEVMVLQVK